MLLYGVLYYLLFSSAVLVYGIGLNRIVTADYGSDFFLLFFRTLITVVCSVLFGKLFIWLLLEDAGMIMLFPFFCALVQIIISAFFQVIVDITAKISTAEFSVSFLATVLAISESFTVGEAVLFSICFVCTFYILLPVIRILQKRLMYTQPVPAFSTGALLFISVAVLLLCLGVINVSWLVPGVLK